MDDLNSQINQILNDPQSMAMLQNMAKNLGLNQNSNQIQQNNSENGPKLDLSQLASVFGQQNSNNSSPPPFDMGMIMQVQNAMQMFSAGNKNVDLLRSLRPLLSARRQKKIDDAIRLLQLFKMLPLLKNLQ